MSLVYYLNECRTNEFSKDSHKRRLLYWEAAPEAVSHRPEAADKRLAQKMPPNGLCRFSKLTKHSKVVKVFKKTVIQELKVKQSKLYLKVSGDFYARKNDHFLIWKS